jgi:hypothetical protein
MAALLPKFKRGENVATGRDWPRRYGLLFLAVALVALDIAPIVIFAAQLPPNSDGVQPFLALKSAWHGNILLSSWQFPEDNFYLTDLPFFAAGAAAMGLSLKLIYVVPAAIYLLLLLAALVLTARAVERPAKGWIAVPAGFVLLGLPVALWPLLAGASHIGTILFALIQFLALQTLLRGDAVRRGPLAVYAVVLAAMVASDPFGLFFMTIPTMIFFAARAWLVRDRRRMSLIPLAATIGAGLVGAGLPFLMQQVGGFATEWSLSGGFVAWRDIGASVSGVVRTLGKLAGVAGNFGPAQSTAIRAIRAACLALVLVSCLSLIARRWRERDELGLLLVLCAAFLIGEAAASKQFLANIASSERYLVPAYVLASIAAAIELPRLIERLRSRTGQGVALAVGAIAGIALAASYVEQAATLASAPPAVATVPQNQLVDWLRARRLRHGIGDYWTAAVANAVAGGTVEIDAVIAGPDGRLKHMAWNSSDAEYNHSRPEFVAFAADNVFGLSLASIGATYGPPLAVEHVADRTVAILAPQ